MREAWARIKEIAGAALELDPARRPGFVRQECGEDDQLRQEVESLLAHHSVADSLFENPPAQSLFALAGNSLIGRRIGAYRVVREIGLGGMAVVYLAARDDREFVRQVAIKMVKAGANSSEILRRFRNERQTLAALDHPNIVKLLDGGTTEEGWPYLVMEYVEGLPIDKYCNEKRLSLPERLRLFCVVCSAVGYAHRHQVIHRDLKPRNILITQDGVPRLLDFGIAKVLSPDLAADQATTVGEWRPMTPEYASPEQVKGQPITAAADIYSLAVLLYEILSGFRPYGTDFSSWAEIEHAVCEQIPADPSAAVKRAKSFPSSDLPSPELALPVISENRRTSTDGLTRSLKGDLDTIVMMALRKEPERRYASVEEFSRDIENHLSGNPVKARKPTLSYRTMKFLRRHQESALVIAAALLAFVVLLGWQLSRLQRSARQGAAPIVMRERPSVAVLEFKNLSGKRETAWLSTAFSEMLTTELAAGESLRIIPGETVSRARIDLSLPDENTFSPETLKRIKNDLGSDFVISGSYLAYGEGQIRVDLRLENASEGKTVAAFSASGNASHISGLVSDFGARIRNKVGVAAVSPFETSGIEASFPTTAEAMKDYSEGLAKLRAFDALGARDLFARAIKADPDFPLAHMALATAFQTLGYDTRAVSESKRALDLAEKLPRQDYLQVEARYFESSRNWDKAIETYRALYSFFPDNLEYALSLARVQTASGRGKEALVTLAALETARPQNRDDPRIDLSRSEAASSFGDNRLRRDAANSAARKAAREGAKLLIARARTHECRALANLGEYAAAAPVCDEARRIYAEAGDKSGLARALHSTAEVPLDQDDYPAAEKLYREALSLTREIGDKQGMGRELGNLALIYKYQGDLLTAQQMMEEALQNQQEARDKNGMAIQSGNIGNVRRMRGDLRGALLFYERSLALSNEVGNRSSAAIATLSIGETLILTGDLAAAAKRSQQAVTAHRNLGERFYLAGALRSLGEVQWLQGNIEKGRSTCEDALAIQEQIGEKNGAAETRLALARMNSDAEKLADTETQVRAALAVFQSLHEMDDEIAARGLLARILARQKLFAEARAHLAVAGGLADRSNNSVVRMPLALDRAYVLAADGDLPGAEKLARDVQRQAQQLGIVRYQLEASLALAEFLARARNSASGRAQLKEVQRAANKAGFGLIALNAAKIL